LKIRERRQESDMATLEQEREAAIERARAKAEKAIQKILLALAEDTMQKIDHVDVDIRTFANLTVNIYFEAPSRAL
jgi:hypothetical protein